MTALKVDWESLAILSLSLHAMTIGQAWDLAGRTKLVRAFGLFAIFALFGYFPHPISAEGRGLGYFALLYWVFFGIGYWRYLDWMEEKISGSRFTRR